ncbi:MAG: GAF domain-containing sensor histidine kinase [Candidatus Nitronauta litoralis]|uniref:GAF domain-containing sensor histidine kinase n=1 Tax=Candidatus Nitronauta litoralis TaxID=2705533 RepID=A0A7T0BTR2_9BACT|nr:MAG: GAF domain-containing sensor histidine kinase [Candidatus Nitronauta litoralis]
MSSIGNNSPQEDSDERITGEYRVLHNVAQILQTKGDLIEMLQQVMRAITHFEDLKVENKAGIFLADNEAKVLRLFTTFGNFSNEFLEKEKEVPFGNCLCGRVAESGDLLMSENCFTDPRHERAYDDMTPHGHYIVPLKSGNELVGILFLYSNIHPAWYQNSQEVLLSIGGLIAGAIQKKQVDLELAAYRDQLESVVESRTAELKATNENLKRSRDQLRKLGNQVQEIREEEKSRIAREVHDQLGQALTALKIDSIQIGKKLPEELSKLKTRAIAMTGVIDETIQSVQRIATELRPPILDAFGLCEAIAWQAKEYESRYHLKFDVDDLQDSIEMDKKMQVSLFRVFQEAVSNVVRHAKATQVKVRIRLEEGELVFSIEDDGIGIREKDVANFESIGLIGIQERILPYNGRAEFLGTPGKGTVVVVRIPLASG